MAATIRDQYQSRVPPPPSGVTGDLAQWMRTIADALNSLPFFSSMSTTNPNSSLTGFPGAVGVNVTSQLTGHLWVKDIGSGNTGWFSLVTHPLTSIRTAASLDSTNVGVNEVMFSLHASGASFGIRSGGTLWLFTSSASTKG